MKLLSLPIILGLLISSNAFSQTDIVGAWEGILEPAPGQKLTIQFIISKQANGSYIAKVNSPDSGVIKNESADSVSYKNGKLYLKAAKSNGSYSGTLNNGVITGEWRHQGGLLPLVLTPLKKPSTGSLEPLIGEWTGKLKVTDSVVYTVVLRVSTAPVTVLIDIPEQGVKGIPAIDVTLEGDQLSLKVPDSNVEYKGKLSRNAISGSLKQGATNMVLNLTKGKYIPPLSGVGLTPADIRLLSGHWIGKIKIPNSTAVLTAVIRFEKATAGLMAYMDSPDESVTDLLITEVSLKGDQLTFKVPGAQSAYVGKLSGNSITGSYTTATGAIALNLAKGKYVTPTAEISESLLKQLLGKWTGTLKTQQASAPISFRFARNAAGKPLAVIEIANGAAKLPITKATLTNGQLSISIAAGDIEYKGKISGNKLEGSWVQGSQDIPLTLTR